MIDTAPLSILDTRPPERRLNVNQKPIVALLFLPVVLPSLLSAPVILLMILTGGPR
jgi:hypothetical protein